MDLQIDLIMEEDLVVMREMGMVMVMVMVMVVTTEDMVGTLGTVIITVVITVITMVVTITINYRRFMNV